MRVWRTAELFVSSLGNGHNTNGASFGALAPVVSGDGKAESHWESFFPSVRPVQAED